MPILAIITLALAFTHSHSSDGKPVIGSFTDARDGKTYKIVKIGEQTWMAENLNYKANGSLCYDHKESYCEKYGRLYNWQTAMKACPSGWHLPSKEEWDELSNFIGGNETAGKHLKAKIGWNNNSKGQDTYGFAALPGAGYVGGGFVDVGNYGCWWSASEDDNDYAYNRRIRYYNENTLWLINNKSVNLFSVRCVKG